MSVNSAFLPSGNTVAFTANAAAPTAVQAASNIGAAQYRLVNAGNVTVFIGSGASASAAQTNSAIPGSNSATSIPVPPNTISVVTLTPNLYFSGITVSGAANVYVTPGDGIGP